MRSFFLINNILYTSEASLEDLSYTLELKYNLNLDKSDYGKLTFLSNDIKKGGKILLNATKGCEKVLYIIKETYPKANIETHFFGENNNKSVDKIVNVLIENSLYDFNPIKKENL